MYAADAFDLLNTRWAGETWARFKLERLFFGSPQMSRNFLTKYRASENPFCFGSKVAERQVLGDIWFGIKTNCCVEPSSVANQVSSIRNAVSASVLVFASIKDESKRVNCDQRLCNFRPSGLGGHARNNRTLYLFTKNSVFVQKKLFLRFYVPDCHPNERASFWAKKTIFEAENLRKVKVIFYRFLWPKSGSVPFSRGKTVGTKILKKFQNKTSHFSYLLIFSQLSKPFFGRVIRLRRTVRYRRNRRRSATFWRLHVQFKVANLKKGVD